MLTGIELLAKVKELGDVSKSDLVRSAGYVSTKKDGSELLSFTAFYVGEAFSKRSSRPLRLRPVCSGRARGVSGTAMNGVRGHR
jgi:hypothetical protein